MDWYKNLISLRFFYSILYLSKKGPHIFLRGSKTWFWESGTISCVWESQELHFKVINYFFYFNFSVNIERFSACPKLQALNLRGNSIHEVSNLESNRHLWRLDLSNNKVIVWIIEPTPENCPLQWFTQDEPAHWHRFVRAFPLCTHKVW